VARAQGPVEQIIRQRVAEHPDATWLKWQDAEVAWRDVLRSGGVPWHLWQPGSLFDGSVTRELRRLAGLR